MEELRIDKNDLNKLSIRDLFYKYVRYLPLYILCIGLALFGAWLYLRYAQEKYSSTGSMILSDVDEGRTDKLDELISKNSKGVNLQNEIEVLRSKPLLTRVVKNLGLEYSYIAKGNIKDMNAYKQAPFTLETIQLNDSNSVFSINIDFVNRSQFTVNNESVKYNFGQVFKTPDGIFKILKQSDPLAGSNFIVKHVPADLVAASIIPTLNVQPKLQGTGILAIQFETTNPYLATDFVNELMTEYNVLTIEQSSRSTDSIISFANRSLSVLDRDIDSLRGKLLSFQKSNDLVSAEIQLSDYLAEARIQDQLLQSRNIAISSLDQIEGYMRRGSESRTTVPSALGIEDETLNGLIGKYNEAQLERRQMLESNILPDNPRIKELDKNIEYLRGSTLENIGVIRKNYSRASGMASSIRSSNKGQASNMPAKIAQQSVIEKELERKLDLYNILDRRRVEATLSKVSTEVSSKVIEKAELNKVPVKPQRGTIQMAAFLLGLVLPTLFIFLKELMNDKIGTRSDIEKVTDAPILGEVGHSFGDKTVIVNKTNRSLIAEQFRILRSNLQYIIGKQDNATILVTSSFGGEGKSFISTNMGAVLALTDKKTIVLEFDLRKPRILAGLDMNKKPGISNYMVGNKDIDELIIPVEGHENLFVLPCGPIPPNPSELLLSERIKELFTVLKQKFNYVVIDTAPVGMVSDALTLGKFADCTLYVTRQGHTFKKQIGLIDEMYNTKKLPHITVILNDVKMPTGGGYYGNYGYGYYGYGEKNRNNYYEDEIRPKKKISEKIVDALNPLTWFRGKN